MERFVFKQWIYPLSIPIISPCIPIKQWLNIDLYPIISDIYPLFPWTKLPKGSLLFSQEARVDARARCGIPKISWFFASLFPPGNWHKLPKKPCDYSILRPNWMYPNWLTAPEVVLGLGTRSHPCKEGPRSQFLHWRCLKIGTNKIPTMLGVSIWKEPILVVPRVPKFWDPPK